MRKVLALTIEIVSTYSLFIYLMIIIKRWLIAIWIKVILKYFTTASVNSLKWDQNGRTLYQDIRGLIELLPSQLHLFQILRRRCLHFYQYHH